MGRRAVTCHLTHEVLHLSCATRSGSPARTTTPATGVTTVVIELRDERVSRASSGWGRATRTGSTARPPRRWPRSSRLLARRPIGRADDRPRSTRRWSSAIGRAWTGRSAGTARPSAPSTSPSTTSSARSWACRSTSCSACPADIPPTDFTIGIDEPEIVAERAARAADFPALKIKLGGPQDLETLRAVRARLRRADPGRREHRLDARRRRAPAARDRRARRRAHRAAVPGPRAIATSRWLQERSSIPIVADESAVTIEDLDALVGVVDGRQRQARQVRRRSGRRRRMLERARELGFRTFLGCMEETSVGIAGVGGGRVAGRLGRPRRLPAPRRRPVRGPRPRTPTTAGSCRPGPAWG